MPGYAPESWTAGGKRRECTNCGRLGHEHKRTADPEDGRMHYGFECPSGPLFADGGVTPATAPSRMLRRKALDLARARHDRRPCEDLDPEARDDGDHQRLVCANCRGILLRWGGEAA